MNIIFICKNDGFGKYVGTDTGKENNETEYINCVNCEELHPIAETQSFEVGAETFDKLMKGENI